MKMKFLPPFKDEGEVVAAWGEARLIRYLDGKTELRGGSREDRLAAQEWISMFWHEAVVGDGSGRRGKWLFTYLKAKSQGMLRSSERRTKLAARAPIEPGTGAEFEGI
jgi:hypothetical protein